MIQYITPNLYEKKRDDLTKMYQLRYKVFFEKKKWDVSVNESIERDDYDEQEMRYLIYKKEDGTVVGCVRLISMQYECMFDGPFQGSLKNREMYAQGSFFEVSRMAVLNDDIEAHNEKVCLSILYHLTKIGLQEGARTHFLFISFPSVIKLYRFYGLNISIVEEIEFYGNKLFICQYIPTEECLQKLEKKM